MGARLGGGEGERLKALSHYGEQIGLVFQIVDDILNIQGKPELLGKTTGSDLRRKKATYPSLFGLEESKRKAEELAESAVQSLTLFGGEADPLREIAWFIVKREI